MSNATLEPARDRTLYENEVRQVGGLDEPRRQGLVSSSFEFVNESLRSSQAFSFHRGTDVLTLERHLQELARLPRNWDSYGALPISLVALKYVGHLVTTFRDGGISMPELSPSTDGGVRVEWSDEQREVVIEVNGQGDPTVYYRDAESGEEYEGDPQEGDWRTVLLRIEKGLVT